MTTATRIEVGTCKMGDVFIFERHTGDGVDSWMVRAGNHTIATVDSLARAEAIARTLIGDENLNNEFVAEAPLGKEALADLPLTPKAPKK